MKKIVVAMTGASGVIYGLDLLRHLQAIASVETHLVLSPWAKKNIQLETDLTLQQVQDLADVVYHDNDQGAAIASGSFLHDGMVIVPASMKTVAEIAYGFGENLIGRAADVTIKERRPLIIVPRETPLSVIHLENLTKLAKLGAQIIPPIPSFYTQPKTIADLVTKQTMHLLDALKIPNDLAQRWTGV